jgi:hypothetical protein
MVSFFAVLTEAAAVFWGPLPFAQALQLISPRPLQQQE